MAVGDAAAAKGLTVYASTQDKRLGYQNDNKRGDELAAEITAREALATQVAAKLNKADVIVQTGTPTAVPGSGWSGRIWLKPV